MIDGAEDREAFAEMMAAVYSFYRQPFTAAAFDIWWAAMRQFELAAVRRALGAHAVNPDSGQFLPKPADVVKMMGGTTSDSAQLAWTKVEEAVRSAGAWHSVAFDDPLIHRVVDEMGGWVVLCGTLAKEWPFRHQEFVGRYRAYRARGETPAYPARLVGRIEGENRSNGFETNDAECLKFVGDAPRAQQVMLAGSAGGTKRVTSAGELAALAAPKEEEE